MTNEDLIDHIKQTVVSMQRVQMMSLGIPVPPPEPKPEDKPEEDKPDA